MPISLFWPPIRRATMQILRAPIDSLRPKVLPPRPSEQMSGAGGRGRGSAPAFGSIRGAGISSLRARDAHEG